MTFGFIHSSLSEQQIVGNHVGTAYNIRSTHSAGWKPPSDEAFCLLLPSDLDHGPAAALNSCAAGDIRQKIGTKLTLRTPR